VFPGQDVAVGPLHEDAGNNRNFDGFASHTGSSVATALAAALAGFVYECVRLGVIHAIETKQIDVRSAIRPIDLDTIRVKQNMEQSLRGIGVNSQSGNKCLEVWNRFEEPTRKLKDADGLKEEQLQIVSDLARLLLNKI
jgi:hypothetical protein